MDQPQKENKNFTIWDKFESTASGVPDWIRNKEQTGIILQTLLKTITAQTILISTTKEVFLQTGDVSADTNRKILQVLDAFWDPVQKSDLTRYLKTDDGQVSGFIFSANLFQQLIITLYYQETPTLSTARAHARRIIRALSGQTVASYEAKTVPVDAAIAAQMQKIFEQKARQAAGTQEAESELPNPNEVAKPSPVAQTEQPVQNTEEKQPPKSLDEFMPSMDELLGEDQPADAAAAVDLNATAEVVIDDEPQATQPTTEEPISEDDLASLSAELDEFFMDDDTDIDLEEQKEKLAALLQELPAPDPDFNDDALLGTITDALADGVPNTADSFTLPWEGNEKQATPQETAPVEIEPEEKQEQPQVSFQQAMQHAEQESRSFNVVIMSRIAFGELGEQFEKKFEQYFLQACQVAQCIPEGCRIFSDHIQLKLQLGGKSSIARTVMQIKKVLEIRILENYATFTEELNGKELWIPGQLVFNDQDKMDNKRIQQFITYAQSQR